MTLQREALVAVVAEEDKKHGLNCLRFRLLVFVNHLARNLHPKDESELKAVFGGMGMVVAAEGLEIETQP